MSRETPRGEDSRACASFSIVFSTRRPCVGARPPHAALREPIRVLRMSSACMWIYGRLRHTQKTKERGAEHARTIINRRSSFRRTPPLVSGSCRPLPLHHRVPASCTLLRIAVTFGDVAPHRDSCGDTVQWVRHVPRMVLPLPPLCSGAAYTVMLCLHIYLYGRVPCSSLFLCLYGFASSLHVVSAAPRLTHARSCTCADFVDARWLHTPPHAPAGQL